MTVSDTWSVPATVMGVVLVLSAAHASAAIVSPYRLDEAAGTLTVIGAGRPPAEARHPAQARLMAERAAVVSAYGAAARLLSEVVEAAPTQEGYSVFLRGGKVARSEVAPDGSVTVELEIPLGSDLSRRVGETIHRRGGPPDRGSPDAGINHVEFLARHAIGGPNQITLREWTNRYRAGAWAERTERQ